MKMRESIGGTDISDEMLTAYFDGELADAESERVRAAIDADPALRGEFEQLGLVGALVQHSLARKANQVPQARFEQIWDEIDRAIATGARTSESKEISPSIWGRVWAALKPVRIPIAAAAAAAAVTVFVVGQDDSDPNKEPKVVVEGTNPSTAPPATKDDRPRPKPMPAPTKVADADPVAPLEPAELAPMEVPEASGVEIHNIELGGGGGRISNTGTVTVLYVEEEATQADSERSL